MTMLYSPPGLFWTVVTRDHHIVYYHYLPPGRVNHKRIKIGEVRRHGGSMEREKRQWRAFPENFSGFPPVKRTHVDAMRFLLWVHQHPAEAAEELAQAAEEMREAQLAAQSRIQTDRQWEGHRERLREQAASMPWIQFLGEDPFEGMIPGEEPE